MRRLSWCSGGGAAPEAAAALEAVVESPRFVTSHYARLSDMDAATRELARRVLEAVCGAGVQKTSTTSMSAGCFDCSGSAEAVGRSELAADALVLFNALLRDDMDTGSWGEVELEQVRCESRWCW